MPAAPTISMDGLHGEVSLGAVRYVGTTAGTLLGGRIMAQRWFDNFALVGGFHIATDGNDGLAGGAFAGARVLGSSTKSGPFAGMGIGLLHLTVNPPSTGPSPTYQRRETEEKFGATAYAEIGAIARGRWIIGARLDLPMFTVSGAEPDRVDSGGGSIAFGRTNVRPIGIGLEVGFIF